MVSFEDAYPPITQVALLDIEIGMDWYDFAESHPNENYVVIPQYAFFRIKDGRSVMVASAYTEVGSVIQKVSVYDRTTLATKAEFSALKKGSSLEEIITKIGIPISENRSFSSTYLLYFPMSNGQICSMRISPADYTLQSLEFIDSIQN